LRIEWVAYHVLDRLMQCSLAPVVVHKSFESTPTAQHVAWATKFPSTAIPNQAVGIQFKGIPGCCADSVGLGGYSMTISFESKMISAFAVPKTRALFRRTPETVRLTIGEV
jgi:hypothetical protein